MIQLKAETKMRKVLSETEGTQNSEIGEQSKD
jgi:hypothetical protein